MTVVNTSTAEHYSWEDVCSGWHLLQRDDFSVIQECVPPGQREQRHFHSVSRQFFYILQGEAIMELDGHEFVLGIQQGIEIPPGAAHQFRNESNAEVKFLVISVPKAHGDRITI